MVTTAAIRIDFQPSIKLISSARQFVSDFYGTFLAEPDVVSRIGLATHELLENVIKYSTDGLTRLEIELVDPNGSEATLRIRLKNRTVPERANELKQIVNELESTRDPVAAYLEIMKRNASREHGSGLGLARIRAEAEMDLHCVVEGDEVTIVAETLVPVLMGES